MFFDGVPGLLDDRDHLASRDAARRAQQHQTGAVRRGRLAGVGLWPRSGFGDRPGFRAPREEEMRQVLEPAAERARGGSARGAAMRRWRSLRT
jgi:hypothetical protein